MIEKIFDEVCQKVVENPTYYTDFARLKGIMYNYKTQTGFSADYLPFSCFPTIIKEEQLQQLKQVQIAYQKLLWKISEDRETINKIFLETKNSDSFVEKILRLYNQTSSDLNKQNVVCTIVRNDYLFDQTVQSWNLVQYNLIAAGLGSLNERLQNMIYQLIKTKFINEFQSLSKLGYEVPESQHFSTSQDAVIVAFKMYGNLNSIFLCISQKEERNIFDQREFQLKMNQAGIKSRRSHFQQLKNKLKLNQETRKLYFQDQQVGMVYFRSGFKPSEYDEDVWELRKIIQLSKAIKIPTIGMQLINFKRTQLQLGNPFFLAKYLQKQEINAILRIHTPMYHFQHNTSSFNIQTLAEQYADWVLKPNREGGGNNIYGIQIIRKLEMLSHEERKSYILMKKIKSKVSQSIMFKRNGLNIGKVNTELGIFGTIITKDNQIVKNVTGGMLVRTKNHDADEGGISAGFAVLDSIIVKKKNIPK